MRLRVALLVLLALLALERAGRAQDARKAQELVDRGVAAFDRGEYQEAIRLFEDAYRVAPATRLLFNIAQAYARLGDPGCEGALRYYRKFRDALQEHGDDVPSMILARIAEARTCVDRQRGAAAAPAPAEPEPRDEDEDEDDQALHTAVGQTTAEPQISSPPTEGEVPPATSTRRTVGWVVAGAGAAALLTGAVTGGLAIRKESQLLENCSADNECTEAYRDDVRTYERLRLTAIVSSSVGVIALGVGVWLIVTGRPDRATANASARRGAGTLRPWAGADVLGVSVHF